MSENNTRNNYPTPVSINRCVGNEGKEYIAVAAPLYLFKIEDTTTTTGKHVVRARAAIEKKTRIIAEYLGVDLPEDDTLWISVNFWENQADAFIKYATDKETGEVRNTKVTVAGTLSAHTYDRDDGSTGVDVTLNGNTWWR